MGIGTGLAVAGIGASILNSKSASKAADAQVNASRDATIFQEQMAREAIKSQRDTLTAQLENANDSSAAAIREQINALDARLAIAEETRDKQLGVYQPYQQAGLAGQNQLMNYLGIGGGGGPSYGKFATAEFTPQQFAANQDPGYGFRMSEGLKALDSQAAARGGLISGAALKASQRYGQDLASQEYQNAFNRYQTTRANTLAPYQQLQGVGLESGKGMVGALGGYGASAGDAQSSYGNNVSNLQTGRGQMINSALGNYGNQVTGALTGYGNSAASNMLAAGNAQSAGIIGQSNAINQGISGVSNMYYQNQMLDLLNKKYS